MHNIGRFSNRYAAAHSSCSNVRFLVVHTRQLRTQSSSGCPPPHSSSVRLPGGMPNQYIERYSCAQLQPPAAGLYATLTSSPVDPELVREKTPALARRARNSAACVISILRSSTGHALRFSGSKRASASRQGSDEYNGTRRDAKRSALRNSRPVSASNCCRSSASH